MAVIQHHYSTSVCPRGFVPAPRPRAPYDRSGAASAGGKPVATTRRASSAREPTVRPSHEHAVGQRTHGTAATGVHLDRAHETMRGRTAPSSTTSTRSMIEPARVRGLARLALAENRRPLSAKKGRLQVQARPRSASAISRPANFRAEQRRGGPAGSRSIRPDMTADAPGPAPAAVPTTGSPPVRAPPARRLFACSLKKETSLRPQHARMM